MAFETVDMYAKVSGFLETQAVDIGDLVKKGDVLATIEAPELRQDVEEREAAVAQAKAQHVLAESRLGSALAEREAAAASLSQAEADIARQAANRSLAEKQLDRIKGLRTRSAVSQEVVDEQEHGLESARAGERSAAAAAQTARAQMTAAVAKIQQVKAEIDAAATAIRLCEARAARTRVILDYTRLTAPFDGVVAARNFHPGAFIRSAADGNSIPLLTVERVDRLRVVVQVPDLDVALLDVGDPARVVVDALKGRTFQGVVVRRSRAENASSRTMRVEIDLDNPEGLLCEGMYGRATIETPTAVGTPLAPVGVRPRALDLRDRPGLHRPRRPAQALERDPRRRGRPHRRGHLRPRPR